MTRRLILASVLAAAIGSTGCSVFRPILFWRDTLIVGKVKLTDENGAPIMTPAAGVTLNFINVGGRIEESLLSAQTDATGRYRSPKLIAGEYKVEAMKPSFVIETVTVEVKSHDHKKVEFTLKKIRETEGRSLRESEEENIPNPGEVQITPPSF
jgi:5-hydroxyisourate hydrolase-like protein (transthyretin family)